MPRPANGPAQCTHFPPVPDRHPPTPPSYYAITSPAPLTRNHLHKSQGPGELCRFRHPHLRQPSSGDGRVHCLPAGCGHRRLSGRPFHAHPGGAVLRRLGGSCKRLHVQSISLFGYQLAPFPYSHYRRYLLLLHDLCGKSHLPYGIRIVTCRSRMKGEGSSTTHLRGYGGVPTPSFHWRGGQGRCKERSASRNGWLRHWRPAEPIDMVALKSERAECRPAGLSGLAEAPSEHAPDERPLCDEEVYGVDPPV